MITLLLALGIYNAESEFEVECNPGGRHHRTPNYERTDMVTVFAGDHATRCSRREATQGSFAERCQSLASRGRQGWFSRPEPRV